MPMGTNNPLNLFLLVNKSCRSPKGVAKMNNVQPPFAKKPGIKTSIVSARATISNIPPGTSNPLVSFKP